MQAWGGGVVVLFSSHAEESRNADAVSKNQGSDFSARAVLNVDVALLLEKIRLEYLFNF